MESDTKGDDSDGAEDEAADAVVRDDEVFRVLFGVTTFAEREATRRDLEGIERDAGEYARTRSVTAQTRQNAYPSGRRVPRSVPGVGAHGKRQEPHQFVHTARNVPWDVFCRALRVRALGRRRLIRVKDFDPTKWRVEDSVSTSGLYVPACTVRLAARSICVGAFKWQAVQYITERLETKDAEAPVCAEYERAPGFAELVRDDSDTEDEFVAGYSWMEACSSAVERAMSKKNIGAALDAGFGAMDAFLWAAVVCEYERDAVFADAQGSDVVRVTFAPTDRVHGIGPGVPVRTTLDPSGTGNIVALVRACVLFQDLECLCETGNCATTQQTAVSVDVILCIRTHKGPNQITGRTLEKRGVPAFQLRLRPLPANELRASKPDTVVVTFVRHEKTLLEALSTHSESGVELGLKERR